MALDKSKVRANRGMLVFDGGSRLGYMAEEVTVIYRPDNEPIQVEELANVNLDRLFLSGPVFVRARILQFDASTRAALGKHFIDGDDLVIGTDDIGKKMGDITGGTLVFTPDEIGGVGFTATLAAPVHESEIPINLGVRRVTEWLVSFECFPDPATGKQITLKERTV